MTKDKTASLDAFADVMGDDPDDKPKKSNEFAKMLEESLGKQQKRLSVGDKVKSEILAISKEEVFVSTGTIHDGTVPRKELLNDKGEFLHKVGDEIELYVTQVRGSSTFLSPHKTSVNLAKDLEDAFDMMLPIEGRVSEVCKGGVRVQIMGKSAFCPISQIDFKRTETGEEYVGQKLEFLITKYEEGGRNIVVSRRKYLEEQKGLSDASFAEEKKVGDTITGQVVRIEKFGAFVEISSESGASGAGVEGLVHISELSWTRVADAHEVVTVGQQVTAKIVKIETVEGRMRVGLSMKQASVEPWVNFPAEITEGKVVTGKVTRCLKFGAFVEVAPGIEGLVPLGEMSFTKRVMRSDELFKEGERISVMVKEIHPDTRKILLSLKDAGGDPWESVAYKYPVGAVVQGKVEKRETFGLFVRLDEGVTALLHKSKVADHPEFPFDKLRPGDLVTVQVAEIRQDERRISLGVPSESGSADWKAYQDKTTGTGSMGTLGGAFGDALRLAMEKKAKK